MIIKIVQSLFTKFGGDFKFFRSYGSSPKRDKLCGKRKGCKRNLTENLNYTQQFKQMMRHYWYVTLPVHIVNSSVWFGGCYITTEDCFAVYYELQDNKICIKYILEVHFNLEHLNKDIYHPSLIRGINILSILEDLDADSVLLDYLTHSSMGKFTVTYALFKFMTPFRYATTAFLTKHLVKYLTRIGILKAEKQDKRRRFF